MTLYEISEALMNLVDPETGELLDVEAFQQLQMERQEKLVNIALWIKNLYAEKKAIAEEIRALEARKAAAGRKIDRLTAYLTQMLNGERLNTPRVAVGYAKNPPSTVIDDLPAVMAWAEANHPGALKTTIEVDKSAVKAAIQAGEEVPGARMVQEVRTVIR